MVKELVETRHLDDIRSRIVERIASNINNYRLVNIHGQLGVDIKEIAYKALDLLGLDTVLYIERGMDDSFHKIISRVKRMVSKEATQYNRDIYVLIDNMYLNKSIMAKIKTKILDNYPAKLIVLSPYRVNKGLIEDYGWASIEIKPLSFREYLTYKGYKLKKFPLNYQKLKMLYIENIELSKEFEEYLTTGGLYNLITRSYRNRREYIHNINQLLEKMINLSVQLSKKRDYELMKSLISYLYLNPGMHIYYNKLSELLARDVRSLSNYLRNAYNTYLIMQLKNIATGRRRARSNIKIYPYNHILTYPINLGRIEDENYMSSLIESLIARTIDAKYFWRKGGKEIDLIWQRGETNIPISVRYIKRLSKREIKKVGTGFKKMGVKKGILISKDVFDYVSNGVDILIIPVWLFLLIA